MNCMMIRGVAGKGKWASRVQAGAWGCSGAKAVGFCTVSHMTVGQGLSSALGCGSKWWNFRPVALGWCNA